MRVIGALGACVLLGACSTIMEGRAQHIAVSTNPPGADCGLYRQGALIGRTQTPGSVLIEKSKYDIWIACVKQGYEQTTYYNHSGVAQMTLGNMVSFGAVGWAVDSATGSDNRYDSPVAITMTPARSGQPGLPPTLPATFDAVAPAAGQRVAPAQPASPSPTPPPPPRPASPQEPVWQRDPKTN
jgi:hypothetical protein